MSILELFQTPVYFGFDSVDTSNLTDTILEMQVAPSAVVSNDGGWQSPSKDLTLIDKLICNHAKKYFRSLGNESVLFNITAQWANINGPSCSNLAHSHGTSDFSGVFYVKVPDNSGDLFLHNIHAPANPLGHIFPLSTHTKSGHRIKPETGLIVMFPGNTLHSVTTNRSTEDRISIAFNIDIDK